VVRVICARRFVAPGQFFVYTVTVQRFSLRFANEVFTRSVRRPMTAALL
jgi:hypothetical protein